jgi:hypothetical protein
MKTLTIALILAGPIVASAFIQSAASQNARRDARQSTQNRDARQSTQNRDARQSTQNSGTYGGYPLSEWYRVDRW